MSDIRSHPRLDVHRRLMRSSDSRRNADGPLGGTKVLGTHGDPRRQDSSLMGALDNCHYRTKRQAANPRRPGRAPSRLAWARSSSSSPPSTVLECCANRLKASSLKPTQTLSFISGWTAWLNRSDKWHSRSRTDPMCSYTTSL